MASEISNDCKASVATTSGVHRYRRSDQPEIADDFLSVEEPLEIRVNGQSVSVTMRTPGDDEALCAGFLLTEGMIHSRDDIAAIGPWPTLPQGIGNVMNVTLSPNVTIDMAKLTRHVFASSSCGLCGKASIANVQMQFPALPADNSQAGIALSVVRSLPAALLAAQESFARTGGLHAAGIFDASGQLIVAREDVGRHNAVDKVIGHGLLNGMPPFAQHVLLVSGRASFEIVQKALAARIPIVAAVSAPSSLAVDFAKANGQTLIGFLRGESLNVYCHPERVRNTSSTGSADVPVGLLPGTVRMFR